MPSIRDLGEYAEASFRLTLKQCYWWRLARSDVIAVGWVDSGTRPGDRRNLRRAALVQFRIRGSTLLRSDQLKGGPIARVFPPRKEADGILGPTQGLSLAGPVSILQPVRVEAAHQVLRYRVGYAPQGDQDAASPFRQKGTLQTQGALGLAEVAEPRLARTQHHEVRVEA